MQIPKQKRICSVVLHAFAECLMYAQMVDLRLGYAGGSYDDGDDDDDEDDFYDRTAARSQTPLLRRDQQKVIW